MSAASLRTQNRYVFLRVGAAALLCVGLGNLQARGQGLTTTTTSVDFGSSSLNAPAAPQTVQFTIAAGSAATISSAEALTLGAPNLDYSIVSNSCTGTLIGPANCSVQLGFTPTQRGLRRGALTINQGGSQPLIVFLQGVGIGSQLVFSPDTVSVMSTVAPLAPAFFTPTTLILDGSANLLFNDILNSRFLSKSPAGTLSQLFPLAGNMSQMVGLDGAGRIFLSVPQQGTVVRATIGGGGTTITFLGASVTSPSGIALDATGNLYVADDTANRIVRSSTDGSGASVLPLTGLTKPLLQPRGLAVDETYLYIADSGNARIVRVTLATGAATALTLTGAQPYNPYGIALDASGSMYIADTGNRRLLRVLPTLASSAINTPTYSFSAPTGIAVDTNGDILVADNNNGIVRVIRASPSSPLTFTTPTPIGTIDNADGTKSVTLQNIGNTPLQLNVPSGSASNPATTNPSFTIASSSTCPVLHSGSTSASGQLAAAASCTYGIDFTPNVIGPITGDLDIQSMPTGAITPVTSSVPLAGTGAQPADALSISATSSPATVGTPVSLTLKFTLNGQPATAYVGTVTLSSTDPTATFPSGTTYSFTAADAGTHTFSPGIIFGKAGTFAVRATDGTLLGSVNVIVNAAPIVPTVTLTASSASVFITNTVTFNAIVSGPGGSPAPTGTVTFFNGTSAIATVTLNAGGAASTTTVFTATGNQLITARYNGTGPYANAASSPVTEAVGDFTIAVKTGSPAAISALPGASVAYTFTVAPVFTTGLVDRVMLSVTGLPPGATAALSPPSVAGGSVATDVQLTVALASQQAAHRDSPQLWKPVTVAFGVLMLPWVSRRRRRHFRTLFFLAVLTLVSVGFTGCLSNTQNGYFGNKPQTYHLTITGTSGLLMHSTSVDLTVE